MSGRGQLNSNHSQNPELPKVKISKNAVKHALILAKYIKPYGFKFTIAMLFLLISSLATLAIPKELGKMINAATESITNSGDIGSIKKISITLFVIICIQSIFSFFRVIWFVEVSEKSLASIRKDTYFKLITMPMTFFSERRVGELNSRISTDLSQIQDTINTVLPEVLRQGTMLIGGIAMLGFISHKLMLLILCIFPFLVLFGVIFGKFIRKVARGAQDKLADSNTVVEETLQGISNVKAFVNEAFEAIRYNKNINEVVKLAVKGAYYRALFIVFITIGIFGSIIGVSSYGAYLVGLGEISIGDLTSFVLYAGFVTGAMGGFADLYTQLQKTLGSTERVTEILKEKNEPIDINNKKILKPLQGNIAFRDVTFSYPGRSDIKVLKTVSFEVKKGEKVALVGPSGSGKSTISSLILRFYETQEGLLLFDGNAAANYSLSDIRNQVAIVPQDVMLFGGTIRENICYGKLDASEEEIESAARRANAHDFISYLPEKYETIVGERGLKLSGGQRQRVAIARALLKDPTILILDEATSSLDSESERLVQDALKELMKNRTSIIIAHRLSTIREADKIVVINKGEIVEIGSHEDLINQEEGLYKHLNNLQLGLE